MLPSPVCAFKIADILVLNATFYGHLSSPGMYNEIWPTGGWGSIEYGSAVPGQVLGGRWKPLHYVLRASIFADQLCVCTADGSCTALSGPICTILSILSWMCVCTHGRRMLSSPKRT